MVEKRKKSQEGERIVSSKKIPRETIRLKKQPMKLPCRNTCRKRKRPPTGVQKGKV